MNPCQYNVYTRVVGQRTKALRAKFLTLTDASNYAYDQSRGKFWNCPEPTQLVITNLMDDRIEAVYLDGKIIRRRRR